jgi:hypothetical protein
MSVTTEPVADAEEVPSFLLRGPISEVELMQIGTARSPFLQWSVLLRGGVAVAVAAFAFGAGLMIVEGKQGPGAGEVHTIAAHAAVSKGPVLAKPAVTHPIQAQVPTRTEAPAVRDEAAPESGLEAPRQVTTAHIDADPSVGADVRKLSPWPADQTPALNSPPAEPTPAVAASASEGKSDERAHRSERTSQDRAGRSDERRHQTKAGGKHQHRSHADRRRHLAEAPHSHSRRARARSGDGTPSDVGGTQMTAEQLRRDGGSANPLVNAFAGTFGPK